MSSPDLVTAPVEAMGLHWSVGAAGVAILASIVLNLLWSRIGGGSGPEPHPHHEPEAAPSSPHASHSMHGVHGSPVSEGLGAVLGQGAPQMDPEPVAEYDDLDHTEQLSAEEVKRRTEYGVHDDGSIHDTVPTSPLTDAAPEEDEAFEEAATEVIG